METWATFSIIDHRQPIYRQALVLFDKIVVPVPQSPIGNQTIAELEQLDAEVRWLEKEGAAVRREWDPQAFEEWRRPFLAEAMSVRINRDKFQDTRLMISEAVESETVEAVPVYGDQSQYNRAKTELMAVEEALTVAITQRLPVPDPDAPLEDLVRLRNKNRGFRAALTDMLEWKRTRAREIIEKPDRGEAIASALREFEKISAAYAKEMQAANHHKLATVASIFVSVVAFDYLGAIKEGLVSFSELREPSWKKVSEKKCSPGGVVYHYQEALM